jgi:hypothetical protein
MGKNKNKQIKHMWGISMKKTKIPLDLEKFLDCPESGHILIIAGLEAD